MDIPYNFTPRPYQLPLFEAFYNNKKRFLLRWCRRAGKDKTCFNMMVYAACKRVGNYFYVFPSYAQGRKALWECIDKDGFKILDHVPHELRATKSGTNNIEMRLTLVNGSIIRILGAENIDSLVGTNPVGIVISEFAQFDPTTLDFLRPILTENEGWLLLNSTPRGQNHMFKLENKIRNSDDWFVSEVQCLWPDLPNYYPVVGIDDIRKDREAGMTEDMIEQEYGVSYVAGVKGSYYSDCITAARDTKRIGNFPYNDNKWVDTFWDIGHRDDTAIWFVQNDGDRIVFIDYWQGSGMSLPDFVDVLKGRGYRYRTHYFPWDGNMGKFQLNMTHADTFRTLLQAAGMDFDVVVAPKATDKQKAIQLVRSRFSRYFFNQDTCGEALMMLSLYHREWNKHTQTFMEFPKHDWTSHCADALSTEALTGDLHDLDYPRKEIKIETDFDPLE